MNDVIKNGLKLLKGLFKETIQLKTHLCLPSDLLIVLLRNNIDCDS